MLVNILIIYLLISMLIAVMVKNYLEKKYNTYKPEDEDTELYSLYELLVMRKDIFLLYIFISWVPTILKALASLIVKIYYSAKFLLKFRKIYFKLFARKRIKHKIR